MGHDCGKNREECKRTHGLVIVGETLQSLLADAGRASASGGSLAGHVAAALYDQLCGHDEPCPPDTKRQGRWRR